MSLEEPEAFPSGRRSARTTSVSTDFNKLRLGNVSKSLSLRMEIPSRPAFLALPEKIPEARISAKQQSSRGTERKRGKRVEKMHVGGREGGG